MEPTEAAWQVLEEAMEPHLQRVTRLLDLVMSESATVSALGTIAGLYRCKDCVEDDSLLTWAPDFPLEHAQHVIHTLIEQGLELSLPSIVDVAPTGAAS